MNRKNSTSQILSKEKRSENKGLHSRKAPEKRKQWRADYLKHLSLAEIKSFIEELAVKKKAIEREPLYKHIEGVLIDEEKRELFLYLADQKEKIWLQPYFYLIPDTIQKWESGRKTFDLCKKDYPTLQAFDFRDLRVRDQKEKQKEKKKFYEYEDEEEANISAKHWNAQAQEEKSFEEDEEGAEREEFEIDKIGEGVNDNGSHGYDDIKFGKQQSKLKKKQMKKAFYKQEIALRTRDDFEMHYLPVFYKMLGNGKKVDDLISEYIQKNDGHAQMILHQNIDRLEQWEGRVSSLQSDFQAYQWNKMKPKEQIENERFLKQLKYYVINQSEKFSERILQLEDRNQIARHDNEGLMKMIDRLESSFLFEEQNSDPFQSIRTSDLYFSTKDL